MRIMKNGIWTTIQGEGYYAGTPSVFLRLAGCNLRCSWCDTKDSLEDFDIRKRRFIASSTGSAVDVTVTDLSDRLRAEFVTDYPSPTHLVVTGGEPLLQEPHLVLLIDALTDRDELDVFVTVETNSEVKPCADFSELINLASLSPKVFRWVSSDVHRLNIIAVVKAWAQWCPRVQLKIVASSYREIQEACNMISTLRCYADGKLLWAGVQVETSWLTSGRFKKEIIDEGRLPSVIEMLSNHHVEARLVVQQHVFLGVK